MNTSGTCAMEAFLDGQFSTKTTSVQKSNEKLTLGP